LKEGEEILPPAIMIAEAPANSWSKLLILSLAVDVDFKLPEFQARSCSENRWAVGDRAICE
jgi:hypothetical protein